VFHKIFHFTEEGWHNLTRNAALFFLATAVANEAVRFGFADAHIIALNRVFTGIDIWMLFKIFIVMPATVVFFWWQVQFLQKYRQLNPLMYGGSRTASPTELGAPGDPNQATRLALCLPVPAASATEWRVRHHRRC
jgi:hypothetical protein